MRKLILALAMAASFAGRASALTPNELTPQERTRYEAIKSDPKAVESFLATRDYVRRSAAVVSAPENTKLAMGLKRPKNFDAKYLMAGEVDKINAAVKLSLTALAESMYA